MCCTPALMPMAVAPHVRHVQGIPGHVEWPAGGDQDHVSDQLGAAAGCMCTQPAPSAPCPPVTCAGRRSSHERARWLWGASRRHRPAGLAPSQHHATPRSSCVPQPHEAPWRCHAGDLGCHIRRYLAYRRHRVLKCLPRVGLRQQDAFHGGPAVHLSGPPQHRELVQPRGPAKQACQQRRVLGSLGTVLGWSLHLSTVKRATHAQFSACR